MPAIPFYLHVTLSDTRWKSFRRIFLVRLESCRGETICLDADARRFGDQSDSQTFAAALAISGAGTASSYIGLPKPFTAH